MRKNISIIFLLLLSPICWGQTQQEMNNQAFMEYKSSDSEMAKLYKTVMNRLTTKKEKDMLLNAQRAWIKYKETHCTALANQYEGGSIMPLIYYGCLGQLTDERKAQLKEYMPN